MAEFGIVLTKVTEFLHVIIFILNVLLEEHYATGASRFSDMEPKGGRVIRSPECLIQCTNPLPRKNAGPALDRGLADVG